MADGIGVFINKVWFYVNTPQKTANIIIGRSSTGITMTFDGKKSVISFSSEDANNENGVVE